MNDLNSFFTEAISIMRGTSAEQQNEVSQHIDRALYDPNSLFALLNLASQQADAIFKIYCFEYMKIIFKRLSFECFCKDESFVGNFQNFLFSEFQNEANTDVLNYVWYVFDSVAAELFRFVQWPQIIEFAFSILQTENPKNSLALRILKTVFVNLSVDSQIELFSSISAIIKQFLTAQQESTRIQAIELFGSVACSLDNPDMWESVEGFDNSLVEAVKQCVEHNRSETECKRVFSTIGGVMNVHYPYLSSLAPVFLAYSFEVIRSEETSLQMKLRICKLAKKTLSFIIEDNGDIGADPAEVFRTMVILSMAAAQEDDGNLDYQSCKKIISYLSFYIDAAVILSIIEELINEGNINVMIIIEACFASPACRDYFAQNFPMEIITAGLQSGEEKIEEHTITFLLELIAYCFASVMQYYSEIVELLAQHLKTRSVVCCLDILVMKSGISPPFSTEIITKILKKLNKEKYLSMMSDLLSLLSSIIMTLQPSEEGLHGLINIDSLMENSDTVIGVPRLMCSLAKVCPSILADVVQRMQQMLTANSFELNNEIALAILRLIRLFPSPMATDYSKDIVQMLMQIFKLNDETDSSPSIAESHGSALWALGVLFSYSPSELNELQPIIHREIKNPERNVVAGAVRAYKEGAAFFEFSPFCLSMIELDFDPFVTPLVFQALKLGLLASSPEKISEAFDPLLRNLIASADESTEIDQSLATDQSSFIEQRRDLLDSLFDCFGTLALVMKNATSGYCETIFNMMFKFLDRDETIVKTNACTALSMFVCYSGAASEEVVSMFIMAAVQFCHEEIPEYRKASFDGLRNFVEVFGYNQDFDDTVSVALEVVSQRLPFVQHAAAFLLQCYIKGCQAIPIDDVANIAIEICGEYNEISAILARLIAQLHKITPMIAIKAMVMDDPIYNYYLAEFAADFIAKLPDDGTLASMLLNNQGKILKVNQRRSG